MFFLDRGGSFILIKSIQLALLQFHHGRAIASQANLKDTEKKHYLMGAYF